MDRAVKTMMLGVTGPMVGLKLRVMVISVRFLNQLRDAGGYLLSSGTAINHLLSSPVSSKSRSPHAELACT